MRGIWAIMLAILLAGGLADAARAQAEEEAEFLIGGDAFRAGQIVTHAAQGTADLFIAGQTVRVESDIAGTAHAAGQSLRLAGDIGGNLYAFAQDLTLAGAVAGNATVAAQTFEVTGAIGGNLRAAAQTLEIAAPVAGYATLAAQSVEIDAEITGDVHLAAEEVAFGPAARIAGTLTLYEEEIGETEVPDGVIAAANVTRLEIEDWDDRGWEERGPDWRGVIGRFIGGAVMVTLLAALIAALVPERLAEMRRTILARPFAVVGLGFLTESALIGSIFLVAITLIGLFFVPAILVLVGIVTLAGYVIAAYSFGVGLMLAAGRAEPESLPERALAAGIGAFSAAILGIVPILGWIFVLGLSLAGIGAIVQTTWGTPRLSDGQVA